MLPPAAPATRILPLAWTATANAASAAPATSVKTDPVPSPNEVSLTPAVVRRVTAKSSAPLESLLPATRIFPSGWTATASPLSMPPMLNLPLPCPAPAKDVSSWRAVVRRITARSSAPAASVVPATTILPSGATAAAEAKSWLPGMPAPGVKSNVPEVSSAPVAVSRATAKSWNVLTFVRVPAMTTLPSGWSAAPPANSSVVVALVAPRVATVAVPLPAVPKVVSKRALGREHARRREVVAAARVAVADGDDLARPSGRRRHARSRRAS